MSLREVRPLDSSETELLETATLGNFNWCGERFSRADLLRNSDLNRYARVNPARGDFGLVAVHDGLPVAVVWADGVMLRQLHR